MLVSPLLVVARRHRCRRWLTVFKRTNMPHICRCGVWPSSGELTPLEATWYPFYGVVWAGIRCHWNCLPIASHVCRWGLTTCFLGSLNTPSSSTWSLSWLGKVGNSLWHNWANMWICISFTYWKRNCVGALLQVGNPLHLFASFFFLFYYSWLDSLELLYDD
jgi:hypothetical protein